MSQYRKIESNLDLMEELAEIAQEAMEEPELV